MEETSEHKRGHAAAPPRIAILTGNTLEAIGLSALLSRMMPGAEVCVFADAAACEASGLPFFHYFVSAAVLLRHEPYFLERQHKTIVLACGSQLAALSSRFHTLDAGQSEEALTRSFLRLAQRAHGQSGAVPAAVRRAQGGVPTRGTLTPRELDVLRLLVKGRISKEIAHELGVGLTTVISHRRHIYEKLRTRSLSALTIYAVVHGVVDVEDI